MKFRFQFLSGARAGQQVEVPGPMARFGRDPQNEVACDAQRDDKVSTFHAQLLLTDKGELLLSDLGSSNGTFVDGQQLSAPIQVATGAIVSLGGAEDGIKIQITVLPDDPAPAPEPPPPASGSRKKLMIGGIVLLVVVLAISVGVALSSDDPEPSPTPSPTPTASPDASPDASPAASPSAAPSASAAETPAPSAEPAVSPIPSPEPAASPAPSESPSATVENPWRKFGVGTRFVIKTKSVIKVGENTIETEQTMTQTLKSISDTVAEVETKVESDQLPDPSISVMKLRFDEPAKEGPEAVETRSESLAVPAGKFDDVTYSKYEQVMNGQKTVTESWTHKELPVGLKTISTGATSTTTSVLIKIVLKK